MPGKVFLGRSGVASTEHPLASLAACKAMQNGGNAFDGAAAASFALAVTQPHLNGLGGDFFGLFYLAKERRVYCLNSSGWSFSGMTVESLGRRGHRTVPRSGPASVVVPGHAAGVHAMQRRFGALDFSRSLDDAIRLAEDGFPAGRGLVGSLREASPELSEGAKRTFGALREGGLLKQRALAKTLRDVARLGPSGFYSGAPAKSIGETMARAGVVVGEDDLASFEPEWCEPLSR